MYAILLPRDEPGQKKTKCNPGTVLIVIIFVCLKVTLIGLIIAAEVKAANPLNTGYSDVKLKVVFRDDEPLGPNNIDDMIKNEYRFDYDFEADKGSKSQYEVGRDSKPEFDVDQDSKSEFEGDKESKSEFGADKDTKSGLNVDNASGSEFEVDKPSNSEFEVDKQSKSEFEVYKQSKSEFEVDKESKSEFGLDMDTKSEFEVDKDSKSGLDVDKASGSEFEVDKQSRSEFKVDKQSKSEFQVDKKSKLEFQVDTESKSEFEVDKDSKSELDSAKASEPEFNFVKIEEQFDDHWDPPFSKTLTSVDGDDDASIHGNLLHILGRQKLSNGIQDGEINRRHDMLSTNRISVGSDVDSSAPETKIYIKGVPTKSGSSKSAINEIQATMQKFQQIVGRMLRAKCDESSNEIPNGVGEESVRSMRKRLKAWIVTTSMPDCGKTTASIAVDKCGNLSYHC